MALRLFFFTLMAISCAAAEGDNKILNCEVGMSQTDTYKKLPCETIRYHGFTSGTNYIKIKIKDKLTGKILNMIANNWDFAAFLATERGFETDKLGRIIDNETFMRFKEKQYIDFMIKNEGKTLEINLVDYEKYIGKARFGKESAGKQFVQSLIFEKAMTLEQLCVKNEKELIDKYFEFNDITGEGSLKREQEYRNEISKNPAFIATLVDLGFLVGRGDYLPFLLIKKCR